MSDEARLELLQIELVEALGRVEDLAQRAESLMLDAGQLQVRLSGIYANINQLSKEQNNAKPATTT